MGLNTTPSPWEVRDGFIYGADGDIVAEGYGYVGDDNLISAAPELLSELIRLRNIVASYKQDSGDNLDITDSVIAKALGQQ
ncbi:MULTISPECIES: hypothetical protein [unclassified Providencia]|uniref:hypothetical protein n=1 Tax=unclassified Providencia TaxID=2633465 RepID=UPI0013DFE7C2|nr:MULTISPECIES: hypothetical protein [unclassified Providencia]QIF58579.1 hypothetical protein FVA69_14520 [Providencia sp. 1701011]QIF62608.1 hypothetical protein FVA70_14540 [Providencia sp. 1701091]